MVVPEIITSGQNPKIKALLELQDKSRERRRQNLIAARYKAPSEDEILNASLVNQMCITDFPEFMPASD